MISPSWRALFMCAVISSSAGAQVDPQGLVGTLGYMRTWIRLDDRPGEYIRDGAFNIALGYRLQAPWWKTHAVALTPHASLAFTHLRGIEENSTDVAYSLVSLGGQLSWRIMREIRPYISMRTGGSTIERMDGAALTNYSGSARTFVYGIELPRTETGRGFDIAIMSTWGAFDTIEVQKAKSPVSLGYHSTLLLLGWSGRFRGTDIFFR